MEDGAVVFLRRHGRATGPRLVVSHGNGLAGDLYYPFWSLLADRFDLVVHDLRSHGWNPLSSLRDHNVPSLVRDSETISAAIEEHFGPKPAIGVYHSVSALSALFHPSVDYQFDALVLFDPPFGPPGGAAADLQTKLDAVARRARRRRARFETREEFSEMIDGSPAFALVPPETRALFSQTVLRPAVDGGYELCCSPAHEAQVFEYLFGWAMQAPDYLESLRCPAKAIGADPTVRHSYMPSLDLSVLTKLDYDFIVDSTHFLQLEFPETCVALMTGFLEEHSLC